ncbi:MAG: motility associated factor glycosyltransferase family protein [Spirochaetales bacterium]|nr:motility associated factor glycosyltransferase family protein [Spirochaetales bacterium]
MNHYISNLSVLKKRFPALAVMLPAAKETLELLAVETAKDGNPTARLDGTYIHSRYSPETEGARLAGLYKNEKKVCFIFEGCGYGYAAEFLCREHEDVPVILVEPDIRLFSDVLMGRDFSAIFTHAYLYIITDSPASAINRILPLYRDYRFVTIKNKAIVGNNEHYFNELEAHVRKYTARRDVNNLTLRKFGRLWVKNLFANFAAGKITNGIDIFLNRFSDYPALVLAAGPSLDDNIEIVRRLAECCLVVAVDSSVNFCLKNEIAPDFIVTVDPQYYNSRHLDRQFVEKIVLVAESSTCSRSIRRHKGPVVAGASFFPLGEYFDGLFHFREKLGAGGSVTTAAWDFARICGCSEIFIAGLDLGYVDGKTHYRGSHYETAFSSRAYRLNTNDTYAMTLCNSTNSVAVRDFRGKKLQSDQRLNVYRWWFEQQKINHPECTSIMLDERSSFIEGYTVIDSADIKKYKPKGDAISNSVSKLFKNSTVTKLKGHIEELYGNLEHISSLTRQALRLLARTDVASENEYRTILASLDKIDADIMQGPCNEIISFLLQDEIAEVQSLAGMANPLKQSDKLYSSIKRTADLYITYIKKYFCY